MTTDIQDLHERILAGLGSEDPSLLETSAHAARPADIAEVLDLLDDEDRSRLLYALDPRTAAEVIVLLDEAVRGQVVEELDERAISEIVRELPPDDAADIVAELDEEQSDEVLEQIPPAQSAEISQLLSYDESTAGGIMNPRLVSISAEGTVAEAVESVRSFAIDEDLHFVYVVDSQRRLVGVVPLRCLVVNPPTTTIEAIDIRDPVTVNVHDDQEHVLQVMQKYDLPAVPVVDDDGKLLGRITYDDVMDVAQEEAAEDIYRMAGTAAPELETHSAFRAARVRMGWLIPCMFGTLLAGGVIAYFGESNLTDAHMHALLMFVPMIAATSGNAGIQTSTIVLRGLATGELSTSKFRWVFLREFRISVLVGLLCSVGTGALAAGLLIALRRLHYTVATSADVHSVLMGTSVCLGMLCAIVSSFVLGISLPFIFRKFGVDPAIASGPLITSANDLLSVGVYLSIALAILT